MGHIAGFQLRHLGKWLARAGVVSNP